MSEVRNRWIWATAAPTFGLSLLLGLLVVWQGAVWALWGLAALPIALIVTLVFVRGKILSTGREHMPRYLVSRAVHGLADEWNHTHALLRKLQNDWNWTAPQENDLVQAAALLEPHVIRSRTTGYWEVRRGNLGRLPMDRIQDASQRGKAALAALRLVLAEETKRQEAHHARLLADLQARGLCSFAPRPAAGPTEDWKGLVARIERLRDEQELAADEALAILVKKNAAGAGPDVARARQEAEAALTAGQPRSALEALRRSGPATATPVPRPPPRIRAGKGDL